MGPITASCGHGICNKCVGGQKFCLEREHMKGFES